MEGSLFIPLIASVVLISGVVVCFSSSHPDPREPPIVSSTIPFIGHFLGLVKYGGAYYDKIRFVNIYVYWEE